MDPLAGIVESLDAVRVVWSGGSAAALRRDQLVAVVDALGRVARHVDALAGQVAAELARESRPELGAESLAKQHGFRNPVALISATTGVSTAEAQRLLAVGEGTAPRMTFTGQCAPAKHPHVADAVCAGRIGTDAAAAIIRMLDRVALRADREGIDRAEAALCAQAPGLTLDQLMKIIVRAEAWLDPDGLEPRERDLRGERELHLFERDGMVHLRGRFDPQSAAAVKTAIEAIVTAQFRAAAADARGSEGDVRSVPQRQADALSLIAAHVLDCDHDGLPIGGATVIVRMTLADLQSGTGIATIDGLTQPISVATARRMAASGGIIPCVLGSAGEILDFGREKRLFTRVQKLALIERDGGCAMCGLPPGMAKVHHLKWWARDAGPTDLANGVLLCESCHHRIHDNDWDIRIEGSGTTAHVWFIPPPHIDPARAPRLGGRARFDFHAA